MTNKIRSLKYLKDNAPMCKNKDNKFIPDFSTRYFLEDYPYGLCIIKDFCAICEVDTPYIDKILIWYEKIMDKQYFIDGTFTGSDLKELALPQNYEIKNISDIYNFYEKLK